MKQHEIIPKNNKTPVVPLTTPRNFVAKNAKSSGAGAHADKKKEAKRGIEKHKKDISAMGESADQSVTEGDVVQFPQKHPWYAAKTCPKCEEGSLVGGKTSDGRVKYCMGCGAVYPEPNTNKDVAEAAKWRGDPAAYDVDDEGNKSPKTPNKFSYDPLAHRQNTAGDAKTARGKKWALKTSIGMAKGQHGPKGYLPEQGVAEGLNPKLGTVRANLMHTEKPTVQVQVFKHNTLRGDSYWVTKEVKKFKTMDHAQAYIDRINKQNVAEGLEDREQNRIWQMITDYEQRAKATKNDLKKQHLMRMAQELRGKLKTSNDQSVAEAGLKFHGGFPDVDHMRGSVIRNASMTTDNVKVNNKDEWERAVNSINAKVFDDDSEFVSNSNVKAVKINGVVWAKWNNATQTGWFNAKGQALKPYSLGEETGDTSEKLNELSPQTLASYKKKASAASSEADKRGDFEKGHKRFKGIIKATKKEFENDRKNVKENTESTVDKKTNSKITALEKKINDARDAIGLARERRKMKGQRQQGAREMALNSKMNDLRQQIDTIKREAVQTTESVDLDDTGGNPVDVVTLDVPLLIRIMEYAREDAKTDMDLHVVAEKMIELCTTGQHLTMQDYDAIIQQESDTANDSDAMNISESIAMNKLLLNAGLNKNK